MMQTNSRVPECSICIGPIKEPVITECYHSFCQPCISAWLQTKSICPLCQKVISRAPGPNFALREMIEGTARQTTAIAEARIASLVDVVLPIALTKACGAKIVHQKESVHLRVGHYEWIFGLKDEDRRVSILFYKNFCHETLHLLEGLALEIAKTTQSASIVVRGNFKLSPNCIQLAENSGFHLITLAPDVAEAHPLFRVAREVNFGAVTTLVKQGHDVRVRDANNNTALHDLKPYNGWLNCVDLCSLLIDNGLDVDALNNEGQTPLMTLRKMGLAHHEEVMLGLIAKGASLKGLSEETLQALLETALHRCNTSQIGTPRVLSRLLREGKTRVTPACWEMLAAHSPDNELLELIMQHGNRGEAIDFRDELVERCHPFFHNAVCEGELETVQLFLKHHFPYATQQCSWGSGNCLDEAISKCLDDLALLFAQLGMKTRHPLNTITVCKKTKAFLAQGDN